MASFRFYDNADVPLPALYGIAITAVRAQVTPGERVYLAHEGSAWSSWNCVLAIRRRFVGCC